MQGDKWEQTYDTDLKSPYDLLSGESNRTFYEMFELIDLIVNYIYILI
jgi:hypothetical protein